MSEIRVTYSGMISLVVGLTSIFTGLLFTVIISRQLTQEDFGTWALIGGLMGYVYILRPLVGFWSTREISRGIETGKTALISNSFLIPIGLVIYFFIINIYGVNSNIDFSILLFSMILIPVEFTRNILIRISYGFKPQNEEFGIILFEVTKIILGFILVYFLDVGLTGVILAIFAANVSSIFYLYIKTKEKLREQFQFSYVKKWFRLFWIPIYPNISQTLNSIDVAIFTIITGSATGLAYWAAAKAVSKIVAHSGKVGKAVYPKLLGGGKKEYFQENMVLVFYFLFPLASMSIIFARPALFILNPSYEIAIMAVIFLVPMFMLRTLTELFMTALSGIEKIDTYEDAKFIDYLRSKLFYLPTLRNIHRGIYIIILSVMLIILTQTTSEIDLISYWAIIGLITQIPFTAYLYNLSKKELKYEIKTKIILKFVVVSIFIFGLTYYLMNEFLVYEISIFEFLPNFIPYTILGILGYVGITYVIEKRIRYLFKSIIKEFLNKRKNDEL